MEPGESNPRENATGGIVEGSCAQLCAQSSAEPTRADPRSLKRGRLRDVLVLLKSLRFHRPAIAAVVGEQDSRRLATFAGRIIEILEGHPASLDPGTAVVDGVAIASGLSPLGGGSLESRERAALSVSLVARAETVGDSLASSRAKHLGAPLVTPGGAGTADGANGTAAVLPGNEVPS